MTNPIVRPAKVDDLEALAVLFDGYRQFYQQRGDLNGARRYLQARLDAQDSVILVAELDGQLVGFTQLYPSFSSVSMKRLWILNDLFVDPGSRRGGVGQVLMAAAERFARDDGAKGLVLATQKTNSTAKTLYEGRDWKLDDGFDHYYHYFAS
jgi:GNAT superfamily N-acetyltransferase